MGRNWTCCRWTSIGALVERPPPIMRRRVLFVALPAAFLAGRAKAQSLLGALPPVLPLELVSYSSQTLSGTAASLFADKAAALLPDTFRIKVTEQPPTVPFAAIGKASALASYYAPGFAPDEPVLGLSAVPMLAASFDEAEALLRAARPFYAAALARRGQVLLAVEPWRPAALWSTFRLRSAADLRGARFALDGMPYVGSGWAELFVRLGARRVAYGDAEVVLAGGYT